MFGPLDWKRSDFLFASVNQYQAVEPAPLKDFMLFKDPTVKEPEQTEEELMAKLGWREEEE